MGKINKCTSSYSVVLSAPKSEDLIEEGNILIGNRRRKLLERYQGRCGVELPKERDRGTWIAIHAGISVIREMIMIHSSDDNDDFECNSPDGIVRR